MHKATRSTKSGEIQNHHTAVWDGCPRKVVGTDDIQCTTCKPCLRRLIKRGVEGAAARLAEIEAGP